MAAAIADHLALLGLALAQLPPLGRRQLLVRTDSRGASISVLWWKWWLHHRHWTQFNHSGVLGSRRGRRGVLATDR
jgi:hypothetical protein